ncbi:C39 family peptidase [Kribbella sp. NPDC055071]
MAQTTQTADAYQPRDPEFSGPRTVVSPPPSVAPTQADKPQADPAPVDSTPVEPAPAPTSTPTATASPSDPVPEQPAARSWSDVVKQVTDTSPGDLQLRAADTSAQASSIMRCFKLDEENYCLGLGFVDQLPTGAQLQATLSPPDQQAQSEGEVGVEQDIATGDLTPEAFVAERAAMPKGTRVTAELDEMQAAWGGRAKAKELRLLAAGGSPASITGTAGEDAQSSGSTPTTPTAAPTPTPTPTPTRSVPTQTTPTPVPTPTKPAAPAPVKVPASAYIMKGFQTSQEKGYWCGPATFQSIDWADDNQKDTQASWAKDLGSSSGGTAISAMVRQTNLKTTWPKAAGPYVVQNVSDWNAQTFFTVHQKHLGVYKAPVIEHVQLLKRYFPYLAFNHSGHYQVGRGYDKANGTIAIFEVFNERRFNSRGNVTDGPKNIPASALFNATLANSFKNIGL